MDASAAVRYHERTIRDPDSPQPMLTPYARRLLQRVGSRSTVHARQVPHDRLECQVTRSPGDSGAPR